MPDYMVTSEFDVTRRVGWDGTEDLAQHLDAVAERLRQSTDVTSIETDAHLDTGRVHLTIQFTSWEINRLEHSRAVLGVAIRGAGGRHEGLLHEVEFSGSGADKASWSPLRGATWTLRRFDLDSGDTR